MEFDNAFRVSLPPDQAWALLLDVERIAPCMPGAQLTEIVGDNTFKGRVSVRLGPVALTFNGSAMLEEVNPEARSAKIVAKGTDAKGRGGANATALFRILGEDGGSTVQVHTNLTMSGAVAQYGRASGLIQEVAGQIIGQFAKSLEQSLASNPVAASAPEPAAVPQPAPVSQPVAEPASPQPIPVPPPSAQAVAETFVPNAVPVEIAPETAAITTAPEPATRRIINQTPAKPVSGFSLLFAAFVRWVRRPFGSASSQTRRH